MNPETIGYIAVALGLASFMPYLYFIVQRQIRPHAISFFIWFISTLVVGLAQLVEGGGAGAWLLLTYGLFCGIAFGLAALYHGERSILVTDWICLALALVGLALWPLTHTPLWSVLVLTTVDALGYLPTYRKTYRNPHEESGVLYFMGSVSFILSALALENYNLTTLFYPVVITWFNLVVVYLVWFRRRS